MRNPRWRWILLVATLTTGLAAVPFLPDPTPIHWNTAGEVDGYGSPWLAALLAPGVILLIALGGPYLPRLDPRRANYAEFQGTYDMVLNVIAWTFTIIHGLTLGFALGLPINISQAVPAVIGLLFALIGNELGRVQPNYFIGIRTPWTLADPENWRRTHRVGGRVMMAGGLLAALAAFFLPAAWQFWVVFPLLLGSGLFGVLYSYLLWRRQNQSDDHKRIEQ
jgi:uncharacterized membrane protein